MVQYNNFLIFDKSVDYINDINEHKSKNEPMVKENATKTYKHEYKVGPIVFLIVIHMVLLYFIYEVLTFQFNWRYFWFHYIYGVWIGMGVTAGTHRLWCHRSYTANVPLRILLMLCQSATMQTNIFQWVRDHRVHHKYTDTDADPHNSTRGFFFSHCGWLCIKKHPDVKAKGKLVDMSDVSSDPVVQFQLKYYPALVVITSFAIPMALQTYFFPECSLLEAFFLRVACYTLSLHWVWSVNSLAHLYGTKPYDKKIRPTENLLVAFLALGEGWHNYHHAFPWDYKTSELGDYKFNITTAFVDFFAKIGWATNLRSASKEMILNRVLRTGDTTLLTTIPKRTK